MCACEVLLMGLDSNNVPVILHVNVQFLIGPVHLVVCTEA